MAELRSVVRKLLEVVKAIHANSPTAAGRGPLNDAERELAELEPPPSPDAKAEKADKAAEKAEKAADKAEKADAEKADKTEKHSGFGKHT